MRFKLTSQYHISSNKQQLVKKGSSREDQYDAVSATYSKTPRIAMCIGSVSRVSGRRFPEQLVILDEARMTLEFLCSEIGQAKAAEALSVLHNQMMNSSLTIIMGAGGARVTGTVLTIDSYCRS